MKFRVLKCLLAVYCGVLVPTKDSFAVVGRLAPQDFNKMYYLAAQGKVGILRSAVNRGLNIDSVNPNGDTGLCIAIKRKNYIAYNSFRMSGANPRHQCTYKIYREYQEFLDTTKTAREEKILGNKESLYYNDDEQSWWPWIIGGVALGGGALALSGGGGGGSAPVVEEVTPIPPGTGLGGYIDNYNELISGQLGGNLLDITFNNDGLSNPDKIRLLPNTLDMYQYMKAYVKVEEGGNFDNWGTLSLSEGTVGLAGFGEKSKVENNGTIEINAKNGVVGLVASNGAVAYNSPDLGEKDVGYGNINMSFKGEKEGDALIGMYADTNSKIINFGRITGTTSEVISSETKNIFAENDLTAIEGDETIVDDTDNGLVEDEEEEEKKNPNSGSMLGMGVFNFYTGTNLSKNEVSAENRGTISLSAGYSKADKVGVSLIGMGSYIDDKFLNENYNPNFAEQMKLDNSGNINLKYQGAYNISEDALKLGDGGLIGIRADASTEAVNTGNIDINLTSTTLEQGVDVAAGMLSVHGAELVNGDKSNVYNGIAENVKGKITIVNDATSGGVSYGMLAAKGDGSQTRVYNWKDPKLTNYGLIDMQVSNSYAMASFDGGEITNYGVINLGVENGHSYYTGNYGMYSEGKDKSDVAKLINKGIINVNSELSTAMQHMFSGSVDMINDGVIHLSSKATGSYAMGGNFSKAINNNAIYYEVDNSADFTYPTGYTDVPEWNVKQGPVASSIQVSESDAAKQIFENNGLMTIGKKVVNTEDYNGTFGTAGVLVSKQGGAINNKDATIHLIEADPTYRQLNVGMYLDDKAEATAYVRNLGDIIVDSYHSMGMLNKSPKVAKAFNLGNIYVNSQRSMGLAGTKDSYLSNGGDNEFNANIFVNGLNSVGMYTKDGEMFNWGNIYLNNAKTKGILLDGEDAVLNEFGNIYHSDIEYEEMVYYGFTNDAKYIFGEDTPINYDIDGYILGKAFTDKMGGIVSLEQGSVANVTKKNGRLFLVDGMGSEANIRGKVNVSDNATGVEVLNRGKASVYGLDSVVNVKDNTAVGFYAEGEDSTVNVADSGILNVDGGKGVVAKVSAKVNNSSNINVNTGVGIEADYKVVVSNSGNIAIKDGKGIIVSSNSNVSNDEMGKITVSSSKACSEGICNLEDYSIGIEADGAIVTSSGKIEGSDTNSAAIGIYAVRGAEVEIKNTDRGHVRGLAVGIYADAGSEINNAGKIMGNNIGIYVKGGNVIDSGSIVSNRYGYYVESGSDVKIKGTVQGNTYGVYAKGGSIDVSGEILTLSYGAYLNNAEMTNNGKITVSAGTGVLVASGGIFENKKDIVVNSGTGIDIENGGKAINAVEGVINVSGENALGVNVQSGGSFTNAGVINYNSEINNCVVGGSNANCNDNAKSVVASSLITLEDGASFVNKGEVNFDDKEVDFNEMAQGEGASVVIAKGGSYIAESFSGDVFADNDIVKGGFEDTYVNENSFVGQNNGINIKSKSYMFDAKISGDNDVELNRKSFEDLVEEKDLAQFFEMNYKLANNEKVYNSLKSATTENEFDERVESESGKKFYANLPRENMAVTRKLNSNEQKRILEDGISEVSVGANYFRTGKDGAGVLSGYEDDVYSAYIGYGNKINKNWSMGATLMGAYQDASYDDVNSSRENKILMVFMPILYQNSKFKYLAMPNVGVGFGSYTRHASSGDYEADTFDIYYGMSNTMEYSVDVKIAELVAEAELNFAGVHSDDAKEKGGFVLKANNSLSLEAGVGLKLRKNIRLAKERSLMLAVGSKYYHEFLDPYKKLDVTTKGSPISFNGGYYDENKNRIKTTAEAVYKDGDLSVSAEISHNKEKESNVEGGVGIRYNF